METEAWTIRLGRQLQELNDDSGEAAYCYLQETLSHAIAQIRFVRKCYHKEAAVKNTP